MSEQDEIKQTAADVDVGTMEDVDAIMKKYDRESNTRIWEGVPKQVVRWLTVAFGIFMIVMNMFLKMDERARRPIFLGLVLLLVFIYYPAKKGTQKVNHMPWYDIVLAALGAVCFFYYPLHLSEIVNYGTRIQKLTWDIGGVSIPILIVFGIVGTLILVEACRRVVGIPIICVASAFVIYAFAGAGKDLKTVVYNLFYTTTGILGTPIGVCSTYIALFVIFGAFLEATGVANFFIDCANTLAGWASGGPAKVAVISSALCGMVSGSSVGNTVTTGSVTIPMMKKCGYKPEFAGAVEAASSTGGQIMPPIMGAAAFLMAEYMGVPYGTVALKAILPAVLYFAGIYIAVHLEARKLKLKGIPREELPKMRELLPKLYLLLPLIVLVVLVATNRYTMQFAATLAIFICIGVGLINKENRINLTKILDALEAGGKGTITVAVACAMAGLVAGCITSTGLASTLIRVIVQVSGGRAFIALLLTMLCCIILGMGVPTTANYCIMAATTAPILIDPRIGIPLVCAHFFVFYFGIVADITPPVALAAYAGSAIAKAPPMKTAFNATRIAIAAFIVPYILAMNPSMVFEFPAGSSGSYIAVQIVLIVVTSLLGIFGVAAALNGYLFRSINPIFRVALAAGGLCMMIPGTLTDVIGLALVAVIVAFQKLGAKKEAAA
ncbi:MAG: TRAP transporter permease [Kiritimatiellae bacterium]|nr:TRAP transporter permease [Kiritimatiellia bacterium]